MLTDFKIEVEETKTYWQMLLKKALIGFFCGMIYFVFFTWRIPQIWTNSYIILAILLPYLTFIAAFFFSFDSSYNCFITKFEITNGSYNIEYTKRGKASTITGKPEDFEIEYGIIYTRSLQPGRYYFQIQNKKGKSLLRQTYGLNWKEPFIKVMTYLQANNLILKRSLKPIILPELNQ